MAGYIGATPVPQATQHRKSFTATAGQTSFATGGYTPKFIDVYLNGVKLAAADFTATNGSDVVLASGAAVGDILETISFTAFEIASQTFSGTTTVDDLSVTGAFTSQGIDDNANATAITIDSSENVGIGEVAPANLLHVKASDTGITPHASAQIVLEREGTNYLQFLTAETGTSGILFGDGSDIDVAQIKYDHNTAAMSFVTEASERMRIAGGNVGIGTSSPTVLLDLESASPIIRLTDSDASGTPECQISGAGGDLIFDADRDNEKASSVMSFKVDGSERLRLTSAGNLGLNTTSPTNYGSSYKTLAVNGSSAASIEGFVNGTLTGYFQSYGGYVIFASKTNVPLFLAQNDTVRAAIDTSGNFHVGKTAVNNDAGCTLYDHGQAYFVTGAGEATLLVNNSGGSNSTNTLIQFYRNSGGVGTVTTSGTSTSYNTSSDYRLKTDVQPMTGASERVQALNPVNFEWIADGTRVDGFLAHEAQAVVPEAITGEKDAMRDEEYEVTPAVYEDVVIDAVEEVLDEEGNVLTEAQPERTEQNLVTEAVMGTRSVPDYQGIDQSKIVPLLTAALQEALTKIDSIETRLTALEAE